LQAGVGTENTHYTSVGARIDSKAVTRPREPDMRTGPNDEKGNKFGMTSFAIRQKQGDLREKSEITR
jgi:hypothetical protein